MGRDCPPQRRSAARKGWARPCSPWPWPAPRGGVLAPGPAADISSTAPGGPATGALHEFAGTPTPCALGPWPAPGHRRLVCRPARGRTQSTRRSSNQPLRLDAPRPVARSTPRPRVAERVVRLGHPGHCSGRAGPCGWYTPIEQPKPPTPTPWPVSSGSTGCPGRWCLRR